MGKKSKGKFGQVSVFIVIAVILIGVVIIVFAFRNKISLPGTSESNSASSEVGAIDKMVEDCIKQRAIDGIRIIGLQGGYVKLPANYFSTDIANVAYGYYGGENILASKPRIEKEISTYVEESVPFCIEDEFNNFNITKQKPEVTTKINPDFVSVSVNMEISADKDNQAFTLDKTHNMAISVRLGKMIDIANEIINKEIKEPNYIPLSYLDGLDYNVLVLPGDDDNMVYAIVDVSNKSKDDIVPYSFLFANKFGGSNDNF